MRSAPVVLAGLLLAYGPASAQVTTNDGALDSLAPQRAPVTRPQQPRRTTPKPAASPAAPHASPPPGSLAPAKTVKPAIPVSPPAILALPPAVAVPLAHPPPAPVVPLANDAPGVATELPNGLRVTFGADRADMNPATVAALTNFAVAQLPRTTTGIDILAYAAGSPDDPSTPRRLSLQRALAARAVLMQAGIPSPRIYPRALGPAGGDQPDRVDIVLGHVTPATTPSAAGVGG